jgi:hypothetical protein
MINEYERIWKAELVTCWEALRNDTTVLSHNGLGPVQTSKTEIPEYTSETMPMMLACPDAKMLFSALHLYSLTTLEIQSIINTNFTGI